MSTVAIYSEGSSDTKVFNESKKGCIYEIFILSPLQAIDSNQLIQINCNN